MAASHTMPGTWLDGLRHCGSRPPGYYQEASAACNLGCYAAHDCAARSCASTDCLIDARMSTDLCRRRCAATCCGTLQRRRGNHLAAGAPLCGVPNPCPHGCAPEVCTHAPMFPAGDPLGARAAGLYSRVLSALDRAGKPAGDEAFDGGRGRSAAPYMVGGAGSNTGGAGSAGQLEPFSGSATPAGRSRPAAAGPYGGSGSPQEGCCGTCGPSGGEYSEGLAGGRAGAAGALRGAGLDSGPAARCGYAEPRTYRARKLCAAPLPGSPKWGGSPCAKLAAKAARLAPERSGELSASLCRQGLPFVESPLNRSWATHDLYQLGYAAGCHRRS